VRLRRVLGEADLPAISRKVLDALRTMPDDEASLENLAATVVHDYGLTLRVLRTANSAYYRRAEHAVSDTPHAMMLLGARTVRQLAAGMRTFDQSPTDSRRIKALIVLSMLTASCAADLARRRHLPDPETARLCGMFRNLGEIAVAGYFPRDYDAVQQHWRASGGATKSVDVAALEVLGFTFDDLGAALAKYWGMPEGVAAAIRTDPAVAAADLTQVTVISHELVHAAYRVPRAARSQPIDQVVERLGKRMNVTVEVALELTRAALRDAQELLTAARLSIDDLRMTRSVLGGGVGRPNAAFPVRRAPPKAPTEAPAVRAARELASRREELIAEAVYAAAPESGADFNRAMVSLAEAVFRGGPFDRVVVCSVAADQTTARARLGLGTAVELLLERFSFDLTPAAGPVALAVLRRQGALLPADRAFTAQDRQFAQSLGASAFGVFPIVLAGQVVGVLYCDRPWNAPPVDGSAVTYVRQLLDDVLRALARRANTESARPASRPTPLGVTPTYSAAVKSEAVLRLLRGESAEAVAGELAVAPAALEAWRGAFLAGAEARLRGVGKRVSGSG
jgi:HD-like signal output (HDOD) protein